MFAQLGRVIGYFSDRPARTFAAVALIAIVFSTIELLIHILLRSIFLPSWSPLVLDCGVVGLSGGLTGWALLRGNRERRQRVRSELMRISALNHEVRNALEVISHSHFDAKDEHREMVFQSIDRIDAALKRLYPVVGGKKGGPEERVVPRSEDKSKGVKHGR